MTIAIDTYNTFYSIERRAADELADALPFMAWAPAATCGANIARHGAVQFGRMCRIEYEIWGGNDRLVKELRTVAGQIGRKALYAAVYVGYLAFIAIALIYHYGSEAIASYVEQSQQISPVQQASDEVMAEMEIGANDAVEITAVAPLPICPDSVETSDAMLMAEEPCDLYQQMSSHELRKECKAAGIQWRNAHGEGKHLQKPEMVELLNAKPGAIA